MKARCVLLNDVDVYCFAVKVRQRRLVPCRRLTKPGQFMQKSVKVTKCQVLLATAAVLCLMPHQAYNGKFPEPHTSSFALVGPRLMPEPSLLLAWRERGGFGLFSLVCVQRFV